MTLPAEYQLVEFDFAGARVLEANVAAWNLKREPVIPTADWDHHQSFTMQLDASHSDYVLLDARDPSIGFVSGTNVRDAPTGFLFNSKLGRTVGPFSVETPQAKILAYDAVRHRLLTSSTWARYNKTVDLWKVGSKGLTHLFSFSPYPPGQQIKLEIDDARFLENDRVALGIMNRLAVYDLANHTALFEVEFDGFAKPHFGSGCDYAYGLMQNHVVAVDLRAGEIAAKSPVQLETANGKTRQPTQLFSISPDLTRLVTMKRRYLEIFDLASGEKTESFFLPTVGERQPYFLDNENVLVTSNMGGSLVNVRLRSAIWNYSWCKLTFGPLGSSEIWATTEKSAASIDQSGGRFSAFATPIPNATAQNLSAAWN